MKLYPKSIMMLFMLLPLALSSQQPDTTVAMEALEPEEEYSETTSEIKFFGDYYVGAGELANENIRVFGGDLFVAGTVEGQIIVVGGDATLESTAVVNGRVVAIGGSVFRKEGAVVNGEVAEANIKEGINLSRRSGSPDDDGKHTFEFEDDFDEGYEWRHTSSAHPQTHWFIYNRDEGFLWTPFNWRWDRGGRSSFKTSLSLGYRFGQSEAAGRLTMEKSFGENHRPAIFVSAFRDSRSDDDFRLPVDENSVAALLARQDFMDRWSEEGYEIGAVLQTEILEVKVNYRVVDISPFAPTDRLVTWFQKERQFRPPLQLPTGSVTSVGGMVGLGTLQTSPLGSSLKVTVAGERILKADSLDTFDRLAANLHLTWEMAPDIVFRNRIMVGESRGDLPQFRAFGVGGLGSVSAHPYKVQSGNRMLQLNSELLLLPDFMDGDHYLAFFFDAGHAWDRDSYLLTDFGTIMGGAVSTAGIGIGDDGLDWRINIARPLDGRDIWETTFRFNLNF